MKLKTAGTEEVSRVRQMILTREATKAEADVLFGGEAKAVRQRDRALLEKLFVQTPAAQSMAHSLQKEAFAHITPAQWDALYKNEKIQKLIEKTGNPHSQEVDNAIVGLASDIYGFHPKTASVHEKIAAVFGVTVPGEVEHAAIPYEHRKKAYEKYIGEKSNEPETGYKKSIGVGTAAGVGIGALVGLATGHPLRGAAIGAPSGAALGAILAKMDKDEIARAKNAIGNIDSDLASRVHEMIQARESRKEMKESLRNSALVSAINKIGPTTHKTEIHNHEREKVPTGKCGSCGAPAAGKKTCEYCGSSDFSKWAAANVEAFFEKKAYLTDAQKRYPELQKAASRPMGGSTPTPNLGARKTLTPSGPTAVRSSLSGGSA